MNLFDDNLRSQILAAIPNPSPPTYTHKIEAGIIRAERWSHDNPRQIGFTDNAASSPRILLGLCALDFEHFRPMRVDCVAGSVTRASADLNIKSWDDTRHAGSSCSWLKLPANDDDIQCGRFDLDEDHPWYKPQEVTTHQVKFTRPYADAPKVAVWLYKLAMPHDQANRVVVEVQDNTREGFTIRVATWLGSTVHGAGVAWIAIPGSRSDITCGRYSTQDVRPSRRDSPHTSGRVTFSGTAFTSLPRVFVAVSSIEFERGINVRLNEMLVTKITPDGFEWHLDTRDGSILYTAAGAYVAFAS